MIVIALQRNLSPTNAVTISKACRGWSVIKDPIYLELSAVESGSNFTPWEFLFVEGKSSSAGSTLQHSGVDDNLLKHLVTV